ncbi:MAG: class I SAM-dependent RNA methyltransferase [Clostridiaceae bacterium]|nr:class I SAM-dependent RNA methyltransferase [Clostridiaceae bacterium]
MEKLNLIATAVFGVEAVVARELKKLGYTEQNVENGRVNFTGDYEAICRSNIWLRTAERVLIKVGEFKALTFDELFEGTKALPWEEWIPEDGEFPVEGKSVKSQLASISDCQAIVKKAVVERLKKVYKRSWFEETGPRYKIEVALLKDVATLTLDTSCAGLHKRGYRKLVGEAPLKETLACAMLLISRWRGDRVLLDPFCGSGTIPIEAAMIAKNIAPGLKREFAAEKWPSIPGYLWERTRTEAMDMIDRERALRIRGTDIDEREVSLARYHAKEAGVDQFIHLQCMPVSGISSRYKYGFIICNPPYGERSGEIKEVEKLYVEMGKIFSKFDTWSFYILSSHPEFEKLFGRKADKKRKLYNGRIMCNYYQFFGPPPPGLQDLNSNELV